MINGNDLIGTKNLPSSFSAVRRASRQARAYYQLVPYPMYSRMTTDWKTEERGPYPRCRPFVRNITNKAASWLFGRPVSFKVANSLEDEMTELINNTWTSNHMTRRSRSMSVIGSNSGGVFLKFSYDKERSEYPQIDILDPAEQVRCYWDPEDITRLLMVRVQYPIYNAIEGEWYWHREDWTDDKCVIYKPTPFSLMVKGEFVDPYSTVNQADEYDKWDIQSSEDNVFGVIPGWYIRNIDSGSEHGDGDLWAVFEAVDQINFTYNLEHKDNQKSIDPKTAYIDLVPADGDQPGTNADSAELVLESKLGDEGKQGKIELLQTNSALRPYLREFAEQLKKELYDAVGSVEADMEDISNKGSLTSTVMRAIFAPLIEKTAEKRQCYGEDGICVFFERMSKGMANLKVAGWREEKDIQIIWPPYVEQTEEEKIELADRQIKLLDNSLTTKDKAIRAIASADGVVDVDKYAEEVETESKEKETKTQQNSLMESALGRVRRQSMEK